MAMAKRERAPGIRKNHIAIYSLKDKQEFNQSTVLYEEVAHIWLGFELYYSQCPSSHSSLMDQAVGSGAGRKYIDNESFS